MTWRMKGDYFENCNCEAHCPCTASGLQARPTYGDCRLIFAIHVDEGSFDGVRLDGLNWVLAVRTPGVMAQGNATAALYLDDRATPEQAQALGTIVSGQAGGVPQLIGQMIPISNFLGVKSVTIEFEKNGLQRSVRVAGVGEIAIQAYPGADGGPVMIENVVHPFAHNNSLTLGTASRATFADYDFQWDNTGKNAHYSPFEWSAG